MTIKYGVLKGKVVDRRVGTKENAHYQVHVVADQVHYRIAINVMSQLAPSEVLYYTNDNFQHPVTAGLPELAEGYTRLESKPDGMALDFIRGNLFDPKEMVPLAYNVPGQDNDLNDKLDMYIKRAMESEDAEIYAFGDAWGPETIADKIFGFNPGNGIHDIHMNQGNTGQFKKDNGVYQDGGLLLHFPSENKWVATFLAFQSQSWHTDDKTGNVIDGPQQPDNGGGTQDPTPTPAPTEEALVYIVGALVNPPGVDNKKETVTLLNSSDRAIDLKGWSIANNAKQAYALQGEIAPGEFRTIAITENAELLRNKGDIITLLDSKGLKIHGVSYTKQQVKGGWTIKF